MFKKCFNCVGFSENYVHYLPKKIMKGGPRDGSAPSNVAKVLRSVEMGPVVYPEIEEQLMKVQLTHPRGSWGIKEENDRKWRAVLNGFLIDFETRFAINGDRWICSASCLDEEGNKYKFKETARF